MKDEKLANLQLTKAEAQAVYLAVDLRIEQLTARSERDHDQIDALRAVFVKLLDLK